MNFLRSLGISDFLEMDNLLWLLRWMERSGKSVNGYSGEYLYAFLKDVSVIMHVKYTEDRKPGFAGLSSHVKSDNFWTLTRTGEAPFRKGEEDALSLWARFQGDDKRRKSIAVRLLFPDVLPNIAPGEEVKMQVAVFALDIRYYSDVDTWAEKEGAVIMGAPMQIAGSVLGKDNGISVIQAEIRKVEMLETYDAKEYPVLFYAVTIDTCYEKLEIFHVADMVSDEAKKLICVGACVYANCVIQGNVALGRYENGAVYDEESCLRLIENAFSLSSFERAEAAFAERAEYIDGDLSVIRTNDRKATVSAVANILTNTVKKEGALYAYLGRAEKFYGTWDDSFTGKGILVLSHTTPAYFREMLSARLDGENKIAAVTVKNVGDYDIRIREERHLPVNEAVCLELVKDALESGDCSRLVNYFSRDIVFTDLTGLKKKGSYEVLDVMA
ncbi:MAG: hypothetical protein LUD41_00820 [Phascolarctobacterium sp.]|nr:hypothetical protein [Phascolarctobacterium sp.]